MVEGTKAVHERVKLMVKELAEKGESPMLNKHLGIARAGRQVGIVPTGSLPSPASVAAAAAHLLVPPADIGSMVKPTHSVSSSFAPGVISAPAKLKAGTGESSQIAKQANATKPAPGIGMRTLPPPKLAVDMAAGKDLFANLPPPADVKTEDVKMEQPDIDMAFNTVVDVDASVDHALPVNTPAVKTETADDASEVKTETDEERRVREVMAA